jgi:nucleoside-diphosphate-sugar epimerase
MRILITGGSGFIGSQLLESLARSDHGLFSLSRQRSEGYLPPIEDGVQRVFCDLRDPAAVRQTLNDIQPDVVIHLASISPVSYSYAHPNEVLEANLIGTVNLSEACRSEAPSLRQFLFASTSETYGCGPLPKREDTPRSPGSPYAVSKVAAETYLLFLRDAYRFPLTILRPFNTYGRKDTTSFVVERTVWQMLHQSTISLGDPSIIRDWLHVDDHVKAYLACLGNKKAVGEIFNFCTGRGVSVADLVHLASRSTGFQGVVEWNKLPKRPLDAPVIVGDADKAERTLGWRPSISLEDGLERVVAHWRRQDELSNPSPLSPLARRAE